MKFIEDKKRDLKMMDHEEGYPFLRYANREDGACLVLTHDEPEDGFSVALEGLNNRDCWVKSFKSKAEADAEFDSHMQ